MNESIILLALGAGALGEEHLAGIRALAPGRRVVASDDRAEIEGLLDRVEIVVGGLPHDLLPRARNLRWLQLWGAGADGLLQSGDVSALEHITITNASGVHAVPISEHILALFLALGRRLNHALRAQVERTWSSPEFGSIAEMAGKTLLVVGLGAIGERTAELGAAFGMRTLGVRRNPERGSPHVEAVYGPQRLREILPQADYIAITLPLTKETRGMFGESEFEACRRSAYLVNIGRGSTIDEPALVRALREGRLAGAGLDVFAHEPLPADSPLWRLDNVIITAHYAGRTPYYDERALAIFTDNLRRYLAGQPLHNVVDARLGY